MDKIYVVLSRTGDYDYSITIINKVFLLEHDAKQYVEEYNKIISEKRAQYEKCQDCGIYRLDDDLEIMSKCARASIYTDVDGEYRYCKNEVTNDDNYNAWIKVMEVE